MAKKRTTQTIEEASVTESTEAVAVAEPGPIERARAAACRARAEAEDLAIAADEILLRWASRFDEVDASGFNLPLIPAEDRAVLQAAGIPTEHHPLRSQLARANRVRRYMEKAGSPAERERARKAAEESEAREAARRPELEKLIREAEEELLRLERATAVATEDHQARVAAIEALQSERCLPEFAQRQRRNAPEAQQAGEIHRRIINLQSQVNGVRRLPNLDALDRVDHFRANGLSASISLQSHGPRKGHEIVPDQDWARYVEQRELEADRLDLEIAGLQQQRKELLERAARSDWYTRRLDDPSWRPCDATADAAS